MTPTPPKLIEAMALRTCTECGVAFKPMPSRPGKKKCRGCRAHPPCKADAKHARDTIRRYIDTNRDRLRERWRRQWHEKKKHTHAARRDPVKEKARRILRSAVVSGAVVKPLTCPECGASGQIHGHHTDYSKPLAVAWLCHRCHGEAHRIDSPLAARLRAGLRVGETL